VTSDELLPIGDVARRAGVAASALRYYEEQGLVSAVRSEGGRRQFHRGVLRRLAFIRAAQNVGLTLDEIRTALTALPDSANPGKADWARLSRSWQQRIDEQIAALGELRDRLTSCIGCGCLSLRDCRLMNPGDQAGTAGPGARYLSPVLRSPSGSGGEPRPSP
jgi:MerR family redox-sensitive transcriptional activator SoxR